MKKYKVGDRVKIVSSPGRWAHCLSVGSCARVCKVDNTDNSLEVTGDLNSHPCTQWVGFEDVATPEPQKIVVTSDGETITARLFSGKELVKSATAKCSPRDEFVFETGAALALDRLLSLNAKAEPAAPKFNKDELVTGRFGCMTGGKWFVVVGERFIYESGGYDFLSALGLDGKMRHYAVECIVEACSFDNARTRREFIWKRPGAKFE